MGRCHVLPLVAGIYARVVRNKWPLVQRSRETMNSAKKPTPESYYWAAFAAYGAVARQE